MKLKSITPITKGNGYIFKVIFEQDKADSVEVTVTAGELVDYKNFRRALLFKTGMLFLNPYVERQPLERLEAAWWQELDRFLGQSEQAS